MKVSQIICSGSGNFASSKSSIPVIQTSINLFRMRFNRDEIIQKFPQNEKYFAGVRFDSDSCVAIRIASAMSERARKELKTNDDNILEGYIKAFVDSLSGTEMDQLIIEGLRNSAETDHYYTFEDIN